MLLTITKMKINRSQRRKLIEKGLYDRAIELRLITGRGWTKEQLLTDAKYKELNDELETLKAKIKMPYIHKH